MSYASVMLRLEGKQDAKLNRENPAQTYVHRLLTIWGSEMVSANRVAAIDPPYRRYGPDTEIQYRPREPHGLAKTSRILSKREADMEFQYRPHIVDTDAIFADAISETPR